MDGAYLDWVELSPITRVSTYSRDVHPVTNNDHGRTSVYDQSCREGQARTHSSNTDHSPITDSQSTLLLRASRYRYPW